MRNTDGERNTDGHGRTRTDAEARTGDEGLIPKHGGYRQLKTFQISELIYDVTVRFCDRYIDRRSRTHDQMVQAARSGRQNIAEGSVDSGTSKKIELKLTGVAKGSLEELRLDYEDFLRQRGLPQWEPDHPVLQRFKARRCASLEDFRGWVAEERRLATQESTDGHGRTQTEEAHPGGTRPGPCSAPGVRAGPCESVSVRVSPRRSVPSAVLAANGALSLLNLCTYLLERQLQAQAAAFEQDGGFTERLYRQRSQRRQTGNG
jgi:four helix bundle suffix protein